MSVKFFDKENLPFVVFIFALVDYLGPVGEVGPAYAGALIVGNVSFVVYNVVVVMESLDFVVWQVFWNRFVRDWRWGPGFDQCGHFATAG